MRSLLAVLVFAAHAAGAAPGSLDPSFGAGGVATVFPSNLYQYAKTDAILPRSDGGAFLTTNINETLVLRVRADGTLDPAYGESGTARPGFLLAAVASAGDFVYAAGLVKSVTGQTLAPKVARLDANGRVDLAFGGGHVEIPWPVSITSVVSTAVDTQGRVVVGAIGSYHFMLVRLLPTGAMDPSFGSGGMAIFGPGHDASLGVPAVQALALDGDRIVVLIRSDGTVSRVARLLDSGAVDPTFVNAGVPSTGEYGPRFIAVSGGSVYVAGILYSTGAARATVVKLVSTGSPDTGFGASGFATLAAPNNLDYMDSFAVSGGRAYVAGRKTFVNAHIAIGLLADGSVDGAFGAQGLIQAPDSSSFFTNGGVVAASPEGVFLGGFIAGFNGPYTPTLNRFSNAGALQWNIKPEVELRLSVAGYVSAMQPDGKMLIAGRNTNRGILARLNADGSLDTSFGADGFADLEDIPFAIVVRPGGTIVVAGRVATAFLPNGAPAGVCGVFGHPGHQAYASDARIAADGKILVAGTSNTDPDWDFFLTRLMPDCSPDAAFGNGGRVLVHLGTNSEFRGVAVQPDGKIVAAGWTYGTEAAPTSYTGVVMRFLPDGAIDATFGDAGRMVIATTATDAYLSSIAVYPDGRIAFGGTTWDDANLDGTARFLVGRLLANGQLDGAFNGGLALAAPTPSGWNWVSTIAIQNDGKLVAGGESGIVPQTHMALARFLPNGQADASFGPSGSVITPSQFSSVIEKLFVGADGKLRAAGASMRPGNWFSFAAARYDLGAMEFPGNDSVDFNADNHPDIIWSNTANGATYLWYMNGPVLGIDALIAQIDPAWKIQGVADFNGDGHPDLVWRNTATGATFVWYMNFSALVSDALLFNLPPEWVIQGVADFNGDGHPDFLMRNSVSGVAFVWFFNDATPIGDQFLFGIDPSWKVEGVADMNADGQPDLLFRNMGSGLAFAWNTQYGGGNLSLASASAPIFSIDPAWEIVQMADWNGDGSPDLLFRNRDTGVVFVWYMNGTTLAGSDFITQIDPSWEIVPHP